MGVVVETAEARRGDKGTRAAAEIADVPASEVAGGQSRVRTRGIAGSDLARDPRVLDERQLPSLRSWLQSCWLQSWLRSWTRSWLRSWLRPTSAVFGVCFSSS